MVASAQVLVLALILSVVAVVAGNRHQMRWQPIKKGQGSRDIEKEPVRVHDTDDDEDLDLFKDDDFFKGSTPIGSGTKNISIQFPQITIPQFTLPQLPTINFDKTGTGLNTLINFPDKTNIAINGNNNNGGIKDFLLGLIGFSSTQQSVRPIIMILLALATGIFWCKVFLYIYTSFFSGGGWFSGESASSFPYGRSFFSNMDLASLSDTADLISRAIDAFHELHESS